MKNDPPATVNSLLKQEGGDDERLIYDTWLKTCYKNTEAIVTNNFMNALLAFNQGRADAPMWDDSVLIGVAMTTDTTAKLTTDTFLPLPYGIGMKQGNVALKRWVDSRLNLMKQKDIFLSILKNSVLTRYVAGFSRNILRPNNSFGYAPAGTPPAETTQLVGIRLDIERSAAIRGCSFSCRRSSPPTTSGRSFRRTTRSSWTGCSTRSRSRPSGSLLRLPDRPGARRRPRPLHPGRQPDHGRLRGGDPQHADPRPDLHDLPSALPQFGILLNQFTVAWLSVMIWGGAFNTGRTSAPASRRCRSAFARPRRRSASAALATFVNVTLPIGFRIALPSSINTYISVLKNTSLMYVIGYAELTTTAINISNLTLETTEALTVLAVTYLALVWTLSALIRLLESRTRRRRAAECPTGSSPSSATSSRLACPAP